MICPKCGGNIPPGATSCGTCGSRFVKGIYCPHCRATIPQTATVCPKCGKPIKQEATFILPPETPKKKKPSKGATVLATALLVFVVFGIIGSCMNSISKGKKELDDAKNEKTSSVSETITNSVPATTPPGESSEKNPSSAAITAEDPIALLELALAEGFGDNYTISADGTTITASVWMDGVALSVAAIQESGGGTEDENWVNVKNSLISMYNSLSDLLVVGGYTDYHLVIHALNDLNHENTLLTITDGVIIYDSLAE